MPRYLYFKQPDKSSFSLWHNVRSNKLPTQVCTDGAVDDDDDDDDEDFNGDDDDDDDDDLAKFKSSLLWIC